jgi:hypothetical protein
MDDVVNRFARELADAIAAAVAENPQVEACREKARAAGFEMKVTLEAVVGFVSRSQSSALAKVGTPTKTVREIPPKRSFEVTANDRRFLRSLRIAADETTEAVEERNRKERIRRQNEEGEDEKTQGSRSNVSEPASCSLPCRLQSFLRCVTQSCRGQILVRACCATLSAAAAAAAGSPR